MLPEWGRFVTAVKLNRGLKDSNHDQLYAYLKQHKVHANENKMLMERFTQQSNDPLAFVSNVSPYQYPSSSSASPQSSFIQPTYQPYFADNTQLDIGLTPTDEMINNLTKQGRQNRVQGNNARRVVASRNGRVQNRVGNANLSQEKLLSVTTTMEQDQDNGVALDEDQLLFIADGHAHTFDVDVDEEPTMFMENLSSSDPTYDEVGLSYDSDILSEVQDHDNYLDNVGEYYEVHKMHTDVQQNYVVDSDTEYTSDGNIISYARYVEDNADHAAQCVSANEQNKVVNASLIAELVRYKEQVEVFERMAKFELTNREQKIDKQMRIIIQDRNVKEELIRNYFMGWIIEWVQFCSIDWAEIMSIQFFKLRNGLLFACYDGPILMLDLWLSKNFILFAFGDELEITKKKVISRNVNRRHSSFTKHITYSLAGGDSNGCADSTRIVGTFVNAVNALKKFVFWRMSTELRKIGFFCNFYRSKRKFPFPIGNHALKGRICSSNLVGAGARTFSLAILSAKEYQHR
ncbi:hypothetical protein Tco_0199177 [Tanacetum coccineum]